MGEYRCELHLRPPFVGFPNLRMPTNASAPILSDITFDNDGSIVLSFLDHAGFQFSAQNAGTDPLDTHLYQHYISAQATCCGLDRRRAQRRSSSSRAASRRRAHRF